MRGWLRDLRLGIELSMRGSRTRTALTAVGMGLAIAVLLVATTLPNAVEQHQLRADAQSWVVTYGSGNDPDEGRDSMAALAARPGALVANVRSVFEGTDLSGVLIQPGSGEVPRPPGVARLPGVGELVVSPALAGRLADPDEVLLRERLPGRVVGEIDRTAVPGPNDLRWYAGSDALAAHGVGNGEVSHIERFGIPAAQADHSLSSVSTFLVLIGSVVLLFPIAILVSTAARFGSARRDRRLAALRLLGSSRRETVRIAAGEALAGALAGIVLGAGLFLLGRVVVEHVTVFSISLFASDLRPSPGLVAAVLVGVVGTTIGATVFSMRRVAIEPLAVTRRARQRRRRLWWRPIALVAGFALLLPLAESGTGGVADDVRVVGGTILVLAGIILLLPWVLEGLVRRGRGWSVPSQLAVRTLQSDSAAASRIVSGVAVAIAGAVALQMLLAGAGDDAGGARGHRSQAAPSNPDATVSWTGPPAERGALRAAIRRTPGVEAVSLLTNQGLEVKGQGDGAQATLSTGTCEDLRELAAVGPCRDGDVFRATTPPVTFELDGQPYTEATAVPEAGDRVKVIAWSGDGAKERWTVPAVRATVPARLDSNGNPTPGIYATPGAGAPIVGERLGLRGYVKLDPDDPSAMTRLQTTIGRFSPFAQTYASDGRQEERELIVVRRALLAGATLLLLLIAASLVVTTIEGLGERRRTFATLAAFGTPPAVLRRAIWWQTAIPVLLGLAMATATGLGLGAVLQRIQFDAVQVDLAGLIQLLGIGVGMIAVVTAAALPLLRRVAAPAELRSE